MRIVYACSTDWSCEICEAPDLEGKMPLYSSIEELKSKRPCWSECGIVRLKIELEEVVEPSRMTELFHNQSDS